MKKNLYSFLLIFLVLSCSKESFNDSIDTTNTDPEVYTIAEVNEYLDQILRQNGDIDWMKTEPKLLYSAIWHGGKVLSIGYGPKNKSFSTEEKTPDIQKALNSIKTILTENATEKTDVTIQEDAILLHRFLYRTSDYANQLSGKRTFSVTFQFRTLFIDTISVAPLGKPSLCE